MALQRTAGPGVRAGSSRPARATRARTCAALPCVRGRVGWGPAFRSQCAFGSPPSRPSTREGRNAPHNRGWRQAQRACVDGAGRPPRRGARANAALPRARGRVGWGPTFRSLRAMGLPPSRPSPVNGGRRQAQRACVDDAGGPPRRGARAYAALPRVRGRVGWGRPFRSQRAIGLPPSRPSPVNGGRRQAQYAAVDDASRQASRCGARADAALPRLRGRVGWGRTFRSLRAMGLPPPRPFRASGRGRRAQCCARPGARRP